MNVLHIQGRRWFQKSYGNTYHTVKVYIDGGLFYESPKTYGYGEQYIQTAQDWLNEKGFLADKDSENWDGKEPLWRYCERKGIQFTYDFSDVSRERDL
jgi:hypothetical protein